jgi:hypothetical protein
MLTGVSWAALPNAGFLTGAANNLAWRVPQAPASAMQKERSS